MQFSLMPSIGGVWQFILVLEVPVAGVLQFNNVQAISNGRKQVGTSDNSWFLTADIKFLIGVVMDYNMLIWTSFHRNASNISSALTLFIPALDGTNYQA